MHVVVIHGIGVRPTALKTTLGAIETRLARAPLRHPSERIIGIDWGSAHGARLNCGGKSIPTFIETGGSVPSQDWTTYLWAQLMREPRYELRLLRSLRNDRISGGRRPLPPSGALSLLREGIERIGEVVLRDDSAIGKALRKFELDGHFMQAVRSALEEETMMAILGGAIEPFTPIRDAMARFLLAETLRSFESDLCRTSEVQLNRHTRLELEQVIAGALAPDEMGMVSDIVKEKVTAMVKDLGTNYLLSRRGGFSSNAAPLMGDLLIYQVRGEVIRGEILEAIDQIDDEVVVIGHSLGGIAAVEILLQGLARKVVKLVTVGSQAGFFHEINALSVLPFQDKPPGQRLPSTFPPWLNVFDPDDFLSYLAAPIFGERVRDVEVHNGLPFPDSHGGYWFNDEFWEVFFEFLHETQC